MFCRLSIVLFVVFSFCFPLCASSVEDKGFNEASGSVYTLSDSVVLALSLTPSYEFGITSESYGQSASHTDEINLDYTIENGNISSSLSDDNSSIFVYYRAVGSDGFSLYLSLDGPLKGTIIEGNTDSIGWEVKWTDDNEKDHTLYYRADGSCSADNGYVLSYTRPSGMLGDSVLWPVSSIEIMDGTSANITPDIYVGTMRITMVME